MSFKLLYFRSEIIEMVTTNVIKWLIDADWFENYSYLIMAFHKD